MVRRSLSLTAIPTAIKKQTNAQKRSRSAWVASMIPLGPCEKKKGGGGKPCVQKKCALSNHTAMLFTRLLSCRRRRRRPVQWSGSTAIVQLVLGSVDTLEAILGRELLLASPVYPLICRATRDAVYSARCAVVQLVLRAGVFHAKSDLAFGEICAYWRRVYFWKVRAEILPREKVPSGACLDHRIRRPLSVAAPTASFGRYRLVLPFLSGGCTMQFVARTRGDITLVDIPALVELCHGYDRDRILPESPLVCVKINRVKASPSFLYGSVRSDGSVHVFTLHINRHRCDLVVDDRQTVSHVHDTPLAIPRRSPLVAQIGCDSSGRYPCVGCELVEMRIVLEAMLSDLSVSAHASMLRQHGTR